MEPQAWEDLEKGDGGVLRTVKDLAAGAAGGVAQVLLGMFDTFLNFVYNKSFCLNFFFGFTF